MSDTKEQLQHARRQFPPPPDLMESLRRRRDRKRRNQRIVAGIVGIAVFVAAVWIVTTGGPFDRAATPALPGGDETGPTAGTGGVTLVLRPTADDRCCLVTTVNPGTSPTTVFCFVEVFDEAGQLVSTHLVPPIPPGHRRSSGFEASPGRQEQGFQSFSLELPDQRYASTCRPAAWHGGGPI
jgi:hypothetical protein